MEWLPNKVVFQMTKKVIPLDGSEGEWSFHCRMAGKTRFWCCCTEYQLYHLGQKCNGIRLYELRGFHLFSWSQCWAWWTSPWALHCPYSGKVAKCLVWQDPLFLFLPPLGFWTFSGLPWSASRPCSSWMKAPKFHQVLWYSYFGKSCEINFRQWSISKRVSSPRPSHQVWRS